MTSVQRWDTYEIALEAAQNYDNPFRDVQLSATFTHRGSGRSIEVDGFYDGGSTWRLRLLPLELGTWEYTTHSKESGLNGKTGWLECIPPQKDYLRGPIQIEG